jgi:hypothetical protein
MNRWIGAPASPARGEEISSFISTEVLLDMLAVDVLVLEDGLALVEFPEETSLDPLAML